MVQENRIVAPLIAIAGPTAVGKSDLAVELALQLGGEIVSADSMQVYREMRIGTAKPSEEEMRGVPHHLIGTVSCRDAFTANDYVAAAREAVEDIARRGKPVIVVGGSGMYLRGLLYGYHFESASGNEALRTFYTDYAARNGNQALHAILAGKNPVRAVQLHVNDVKRVVRALELEDTGKRELPQQTTLPHRLFVLDTDRAELYRRIDARVKRMFQAGLIDEVKSLLDMGIPPDAQAMRAIGYAEIVRKLNSGGNPSDAEAEIAQNSRNFAKRQLTYFRSMNPSIWLNISDGIDTMCRIILDIYRENL